MSVWPEIRDNLLAYGITALVAGAVFCPILFFASRRRLLPLQRRRAGRWTGAEVLLAFALLIYLPGVAIDLLDKLGFFQALFVKPPSWMRKDIWASPLAMLLVLAFLFGLLFTASRTRPANLGLTRARWPQNAALGYAGFLILTPLVLGFYVLALVVFREVFETSPQPHPLEELGKEPLSHAEWLMLFFRATIAAALLEEVFFRGVLQGWLRRASLPGLLAVGAITLGLGSMPLFGSKLVQANVVSVRAATAVGLAASPCGPGPLLAASALETDGALFKDVNPGPLIFAALMVALYGCAIYGGPKYRAVVVVFGSAMVFAAFHSTVWPSPIPLLALGIGLSYLTYRTQNLLGAIVLHGLFNTVACLSLVVSRGT